jgi:pSer/pThr/pTyr-binding forkhead associated (FHA) protein
MAALSERMPPILDIGLKLPRGFRLRITHGPNADSVIESRGPQLSVGSAPGNDLVLPDAQVSAHHLILQWREGSYWVGQGDGGPGGPANGNHAPGALPLRDGSELMLGDTTLRFELLD